MKFTTLTYNANQPTTQQVNVPTNTDYKVGMKVKRNGEVQQLGPDEFTIYTGETSTVEEQMNTTTETLAYASYSYSKTVDIPTEMVGMEVDANDVVFQVKENGEWTSIPQAQASMAQTYDPYAQVKDGNTVLYTCHFKDYPRQWVAADSSTAQKIIFETGKTLKISIYSANCFNPPITGNEQNIDVRVAIIGRREEKVTIPTDADKTNGYVTFTQAAGDNASFRQYGVHIDKGYDYNDVWKITGQFGPTETTPPANFTKPSAKELGIVGITIDGEQFANTAMKITWSNASTPAPANPDDWGKWRSFDINTYVVPYLIGYEGEAAVYLVKADPNAVPAGTVLPDGTVVQEGYNFLRLESGAQNYSQASTTWTLTEDSYLYQGPTRFRANYYFGTAWKFQLGTPFSADFKLNINEFKSQSGDIAETVAEMPEVKVDGTYADGTEFSYSFVTK